uniref:Uncharacterized protein n=1 Tax=Desulfobacca acetoxidans TaxID=60893 RepID=A0A7C3V9F0_9BACT
MGTSTARRGPSTPRWRLAKSIANRYLAPTTASPVEAREVVRRYLAALQETAPGQDLLAEFRLTRKAAQLLGEFGDILAESGLAAALEAWGAAGLKEASPEAAALGLTSAWLQENAGLEAAVIRAALPACLIGAITPSRSRSTREDGPFLVKTFLAMVLSRRLAFDLGESLEAAVIGWPSYHKALTQLENELATAASELSADPPGIGKWQGLAGWLYVTGILEKILKHYEEVGSLT